MLLSFSPLCFLHARTVQVGGLWMRVCLVGGCCVTLLKLVGLGKRKGGTWRLCTGYCKEVLSGEGKEGRVEVVELIE